MARILEAVQTLQTEGGITIAVDSPDQPSNTVTLYPVLSFVCCDNKEAVALASVKAGQTVRPCRFCNCKLSEVNAFLDGNTCEKREAEITLRAIVGGDKAFCSENSIHSDVQVKHNPDNFILLS